MKSKYYIAKRGGVQAGPYDLSAIQQMLASRAISSDFVIWCEGMTEWRPIMEVVPVAAAPALSGMPAVPSAAGKGKDYNLISATVSCIKRYVQFSGRAGRAEYWWFVLAFHILYFCTLLFGFLSALAWPCLILFLPILIVFLACILPFVSAGFRRMQDVGMHGAFFFIPVYGPLVLALRPSSGPNRFGNQPAPPAA